MKINFYLKCFMSICWFFYFSSNNIFCKKLNDETNSLLKDILNESVVVESPSSFIESNHQEKLENIFISQDFNQSEVEHFLLKETIAVDIENKEDEVISYEIQNKESEEQDTGNVQINNSNDDSGSGSVGGIEDIDNDNNDEDIDVDEEEIFDSSNSDTSLKESFNRIESKRDNYSNLTNESVKDYNQLRKNKHNLNPVLKISKIVTSKDLVRLRKSLLRYYDRNSRPLYNSSSAIKVKLGVSIARINALDEMYQVMTSTLQISIRWKDEFLHWNHSVYANSIAFRSNEIWVPDILANNNVNNFKFESKESLRGYGNNIYDLNERNKYFILVQPNGDCRWVFPMKLMTNCQLNQEYFPFDIQECNIDFRSSAYDSEQLTISRFESGVHLQMISDAEFDLLRAHAENLYLNFMPIESKYPTSINSSVVRLTLLMKRKTIFYLNKIILPYFTFYIVTIFTYLLPVDSGEKKSYSTSILISGMIYLKDSSFYIPKTKDLPILSIYFNLNLIFIFICIIITTLIYTIYYLDKTRRPLPNIIKKYLINTKCFSCIHFGILDLNVKNSSLKSVSSSSSSKQKDLIKNANSTKLTFKNHLKNLSEKLDKYETIKRKDYNQVKRLIQNEINQVNDELINLSKNFLLKRDIFEKKTINNNLNELKIELNQLEKNNQKTSSLLLNSNEMENKEEKCFTKTDYLGHEMLNLLKALKMSIVKNNNDIRLETNELDMYDNFFDWFFFCIGWNRKKPQNKLKKTNNDLSAANETKRKSFHFLNTLENLKLNVSKAKCKSTYQTPVHLNPGSSTQLRNDDLNFLNYNYQNVNFNKCGGSLAGAAESLGQRKESPNLQSFHHRRHMHHQRRGSKFHHSQIQLDFNYLNEQDRLFKSDFIQQQQQQHQTKINFMLPEDCKNSIYYSKKAKQFLSLLKDYKTQINKYIDESENRQSTKSLNNIDKVKSNNFNVISSEDQVPAAYTYEWKYLAIVMDRIIFLVFSLIIPICLFVMYLKILIIPKQ